MTANELVRRHGKALVQTYANANSVNTQNQAFHAAVDAVRALAVAQNRTFSVVFREVVALAQQQAEHAA